MPGQAPFRKLEAWPVKMAIWRNEPKEAGGHPYFSAKLSKTYKDGEGKYQETENLGDRDWLTAASLLQEAWRRVICHDREDMQQPVTIAEAKDRAKALKPAW